MYMYIICTWSLGSDDLNVLHQVMKEAISNVIDTQHRLLAFMVEVGDIDDVRTYGVRQNA